MPELVEFTLNRWLSVVLMALYLLLAFRTTTKWWRKLAAIAAADVQRYKAVKAIELLYYTLYFVHPYTMAALIVALHLLALQQLLFEPREWRAMIMCLPALASVGVAEAIKSGIRDVLDQYTEEGYRT